MSKPAGLTTVTTARGDVNGARNPRGGCVGRFDSEPRSRRCVDADRVVARSGNGVGKAQCGGRVYTHNNTPGCLWLMCCDTSHGEGTSTRKCALTEEKECELRERH